MYTPCNNAGGVLKPFRLDLETEQIYAVVQLPARMAGLPDRLETEGLRLAKVPMRSRGGASEGARWPDASSILQPSPWCVP
jgi:hypothetical protein